MNSETTIDEDLAINFPAAWEPPQGSTRFWSSPGTPLIEITAIQLTVGRLAPMSGIGQVI